jgi:hypothetical protein
VLDPQATRIRRVLVPHHSARLGNGFEANHGVQTPITVHIDEHIAIRGLLAGGEAVRHPTPCRLFEPLGSEQKISVAVSLDIARAQGFIL